MNFALIKSPAQGAHSPAPELIREPVQPNCEEILRSLESHVTAAARIMDFDDCRYFNMKDATQVSINLFLALELLEVLKNK